MNKQYWDEFYNKLDNVKSVQCETEFARWVAKFFNNFTGKIIDVGCGNGRDTYFLASKGFSTRGIDQSFEDKELIVKDDFLNIENNFEIIYSRFFIHSLSVEEIHKFIEWSSKAKYFVAEFRIAGDTPEIYKNHKRTLLQPAFICFLLNCYNFETIELHIGRDMAILGFENPLVCRIIAKNKNYEK